MCSMVAGTVAGVAARVALAACFGQGVLVVTTGTGLQTPPPLVPVVLPAAQTVVGTGPRTPATGRLAAVTQPRAAVGVMTGEDRNKGSCC